MNLPQSLAGGVVLLLLAGCTTGYQSASVDENSIQNPSLGWNGYSITIPDRYQLFDPTQTDFSGSSNKDAFHRIFLEDENRYATSLAVVNHERFLLESENDGSFVIFTADIWEFPRPIAMFTSVERNYFLQKLLNDTLVEINDTAAFQEIITLNGHRAFHIQGNYKPYFVKDPIPAFYEEYFILGDLKEVYRIIGLCLEAEKEQMKSTTKKMAESLKI
jgi:hypothetical protein